MIKGESFMMIGYALNRIKLLKRLAALMQIKFFPGAI